MIAKVLDYLRYPSTWQGVTVLLGVVGVVLTPEQTAAIVTAGASVFGAILVLFSDSDVKPK